MNSESCEVSPGSEYDDDFGYMDSYQTKSNAGSPRVEFSNLNAFNMHDYNPDLNNIEDAETPRLTLDVPKDDDSDEKSEEEGEKKVTTKSDPQPRQELALLLNTTPSFYDYNYYMQQANQMASSIPLTFPLSMPPPVQQFSETFQNVVNQHTPNMEKAATNPSWTASTPSSDTSYEETNETPDSELSPENIEAATKFLAGKRSCPICQKEFKVSHGLRGHYTRVHMRQKRFTCPVCQLGFWSNSDLERHMPRHTGQRFTCDACDRTYTSKQRLTEHFRNPSSCWLDPVFLKHVTENIDAQQLL